MLKKISDYRYEIERTGDMNVPGMIYTDEKGMEDIGEDPVKQVENVACLPGIQKYSFAMPDIHLGYGFPIGGVAAFDAESGVISPGGVGYDINCGVRLLRSNIHFEEIKGSLDKVIAYINNSVPSGVGGGGKFSLNKKELMQVLKKGAHWPLERGLGYKGDLDRIEGRGALAFDPDTDCLSDRAIERGMGQVGSLGAGNHFIEIQAVDRIYDGEKAGELGISEGMVTVMIHTGSRGFGYQVCDDYLKLFRSISLKYGIVLKDGQLACAPVNSEEGKKYINAMNAAANYAWANRQAITGAVRACFTAATGKGEQALGLNLVYDVSHNIARMEKHDIDGVEKTLCVHRKGATRALPAGHAMLDGEIKRFGQPVLLPGDMGRYSFVLNPLEGAKETFYSCAHGAGRIMSRAAALKHGKGRNIISELGEKGVIVMAGDKRLLAEEAPYAYKDAENIVEIAEKAGLAKRVARMKPVAVIKG
jgi:tRNA-splicing ligase RtcB